MIPDILDRRTTIVEELPQPSTWLNYAGDQRGLVGQVLGPNTLGELLTVVFVAYDERDQKSRVGLAFGVYVKPIALDGLPADADVSERNFEAPEGVREVQCSLLSPHQPHGETFPDEPGLSWWCPGVVVSW